MASQKLPPKKGKITHVEPIVFDGVQKTDNKGNYKSRVTFEGDAIKYGVNTKDPEAKAWVVGTEVEFVPTVWTNDTDPTQKSYYASLVRKNSFGFGGGGAAPKGIKDYKAEVVLASLKGASQAITVDENLNFKEHFKPYFQAMIAAGVEELKKHYVE